MNKKVDSWKYHKRKGLHLHNKKAKPQNESLVEKVAGKSYKHDDKLMGCKNTKSVSRKCDGGLPRVRV